MRKCTHLTIKGFSTVTMIAAALSVQAASPYRLLSSNELGVEAFAYPNAKEGWCRSNMAISVLAKDESIVFRDGPVAMLTSLGGEIKRQCPNGNSAKIAIYRASTRTLVGSVLNVTAKDNWMLPESAQKDDFTSGSGSQSIELPRCENFQGAREFYVATCVVAGLETKPGIDGVSDWLEKQQKIRSTLECAQNSIGTVENMARIAGRRIPQEKNISPLMDFSDAMTKWCNDSAVENIK